jgi:Cys-rich protein (TIGR01571 family)
MGGEFQNGILGCFSNIGVCAISYFCPCYVYGKVAESVGLSCIKHGVCTLLPCRPCVNKEVREKVREKYGIDGDGTTDLLFHCCLPVCAIAQEANEVQSKNDAPPGTIILSRE